jgi:uncharacterized membrane protein
MTQSFNEMKDMALAKLENKWGNAALVVLIAMIITGATNFIPGASLIIGGPISLGMAIYFLRISRDESVEINNLFDGFKQFGNALGAYLLMLLIIILGFILLIVPGIIAALALSQTFNIMHDEPNLGPIEAMKKSHEMMKGHRGDYFLLNLSFIGWALLCILTIGIGFLFLAPYASVTNAIFYNNLVDYHNKDIKELGSHLEELEY